VCLQFHLLIKMVRSTPQGLVLVLLAFLTTSTSGIFFRRGRGGYGGGYGGGRGYGGHRSGYGGGGYGGGYGGYRGGGGYGYRHG
jgi:hypothetical protein